MFSEYCVWDAKKTYGIPGARAIKVIGYEQYVLSSHIRDNDGTIRSRIDPPDSATTYPHKHYYDVNKNPLDVNGNIVNPKSPDAHIPLK